MTTDQNAPLPPLEPPDEVRSMFRELVDPAVSIKHQDLPSELRQMIDDWYVVGGIAGCGICTWGRCGADGCWPNHRLRVCTKCEDRCVHVC